MMMMMKKRPTILARKLLLMFKTIWPESNIKPVVATLRGEENPPCLSCFFRKTRVEKTS